MKLFWLIFLVVLSRLCFAQLDSAYFNEWGSQTTKDSANYFTVWTKLDSSYIRTGYFSSNNKVKFIENFKEGIKTGKCTFYHKNGELHYEAEFHNSHPIGLVKFFYPNGAIESEKLYERAEKVNRIDETKLSYRLINFYDSAGHWLTKHGFGLAYEYEIGKESICKAQGKIVEGLKDSVWISRFQNGKLYYTENWDKGTLIEGKSFWLDETEYSYDVIEKMAEPPNGMATFYNHVNGRIRYPKEARVQEIEGRVFTEFVVERDGSISKLKVIRGIGGGCDEEAMRVIRGSPKWNPGLQRGRPVKTKFNLAIIFKLS